MAETLKVAQLISSGGFYGAENMLANLLEGLRDQQANVILYVMDNVHNSHLELAARAEARGIPVVIIPCRGRLDVVAVKTLRKSLLANGVAILHTHGYKADLYGYWASRSTRMRIVSTCHNWTKASLSLRLYCIVNKLVLCGFERVVAVSPKVEEELLRSGVRRSRLQVIANGVLLSATSGETAPAISPSVLTIGMATRLVEEKGIADLLEVASQLSGPHRDLRFLVAGEGPLRAQFQAQACALGIADRITFLGFVSDMSAFYASLDIFVLPSLREGFPMSLLEAMAAAKPVIASRTGAIPSAVIDNWSGLLIEPGDTPALASALQRLIENPALRTRLGDNARLLVEASYSARVMSGLYLSLYRDVMRMLPDELVSTCSDVSKGVKQS